MDVLLIPVGSHGDVHPFIGVGLAMRERGHRVRAFTSGYYADLFDAVDIELDDAFPGDAFRALLDDPALWRAGIASARRVVGMAVEQAERQYAYLAERAVDPDLLVLASPLALGARVAEDRFGLRLATLQLAPGAIASIVDPPRVFGLYSPPWVPLWARRVKHRVLGWVADRTFSGVNRLRREAGLAPARDIVGHWWNSPRLTIGLFPEWYSGRPSDWPDSIRTTGFPLYDEADVTPLDASLDAFLNECGPQRRPIAFTPGSAMTQGAAFFAAAAGACARLGCPGLLLTRHAGQVPENLPPGVRHVSYAPFSALLPRVAALVHHGGIGTLAQACAAGTPQLVTPMAHDQFDNAERVRRLGVGARVAMRGLDADRLARALTGLLTDAALAERATALARRVAGEDGIGRTCDLLEAMR